MITSRHSHKDFLKSQSVIRRRKKRMMRVLAIRAALFIFLVGGAVALVWIPQLAVSKVVVAGASGDKTQAVEAEVSHILEGKYLGIFPKRDFIFYPKKEIVGAILKKYPEIGAVSAGIENFHTLNVRLTERTPAAMWCQENTCYAVDSDAYVYAPIAPDAVGGEVYKKLLPIYATASSTEKEAKNLIGSRALPTKLFSDILEISAELSSSSLPVENVLLAGGGQYVFKIEQNGKILFSDKKPFKQSFEDLLSAYHSPVFSTSSAFQYIDVRFGNKVFYRLGSIAAAEKTSSSTDLSVPVSIDTTSSTKQR